MATAREVIAEALREHPEDLFGWAGPQGLQRAMSNSVADAALAALDAKGLCVVSKADVENAVSVLRKVIAHADNMGGLSLMQPEVDAADRLDAALAAGGAHGNG